MQCIEIRCTCCVVQCRSVWFTIHLVPGSRFTVYNICKFCINVSNITILCSCNTVHCIECIAVQKRSEQVSTVQYCAVQCSTVQCSAVLCSAVQYIHYLARVGRKSRVGTAPHVPACALLYSTSLHYYSTLQHFTTTLLYSSLLYSALLHYFTLLHCATTLHYSTLLHCTTILHCNAHNLQRCTDSIALTTQSLVHSLYILH